MLLNRIASLSENSFFCWMRLYVKSIVFGIVYLGRILQNMKTSEEVVFPSHVVSGVLLNLIKNLNFCGCTAAVARLLVQVQRLQGFGQEWLQFDIRHAVSASKISCTG